MSRGKETPRENNDNTQKLLKNMNASSVNLNEAKLATENLAKENTRCYNLGMEVSLHLFGRTTTEKTKKIVEDIKKLNVNNIRAFLHWTVAWSWGKFFGELYSKYRFPEKDVLIKHVASALSDFFENWEGPDSVRARKNREICKKSKISKDDAEYLDIMAKDLCSFGWVYR